MIEFPRSTYYYRSTSHALGLTDEHLVELISAIQDEFERLKQRSVMVRQVGFLTLGMLTFLLIFASSWVAFYIARGLTMPIKALA